MALKVPKFKLAPRQAGLVLGIVVVLIAVIYLVVAYSRGNDSSRPRSFALKVWGVEEKERFDLLARGYRAANPGVQIDYRQFPESTYDNALINAMASGEGPDVFMIKNSAVPRHRKRLAPAPNTTIALTTVREIFPQAVEQDFYYQGQLYALPLYFDTMAMLYNKNLFDQANIIAPPATWNQFLDIVPLLRQVNFNNQLTQRAAAIGTSEKNIDAGMDLLQLLMLQNGTPMVNLSQVSAAFDQAGSQGNYPGRQAVSFYLQFSDPSSNYFTWSTGEENSIESFSSGKTAIIFNYQSVLPIIQKKSPFLSLGIAPVPQADTSKTVNIASYWGLALSKQSKIAPADAWDFIRVVTTSEIVQKDYSNASQHPPALRSFIGQKLNAPLGAFSKQALTARSWYQPDDRRVDVIFNTMIENILNGQTSLEQSLMQAQDQVSQLIRASL